MVSPDKRQGYKVFLGMETLAEQLWDPSPGGNTSDHLILALPQLFTRTCFGFADGVVFRVGI